MPAPSPLPAEPHLPESAGSGLLRGTLYTVLAAMLLAGVWIRFNPQIAAIAPGLAAPAADLAAQVADPGRARGLLEVELVPLSETAQAVAAMRLPSDQAAALAAAVRRGDVRLVRLPLFDFAPPADDAIDMARVIEVSAAGYTRAVPLGRLPVAVTLPIAKMGTVALRNPGGGTVAVGAVTLTGPVRLPDLPSAAVLDVGVIAQ